LIERLTQAVCAPNFASLAARKLIKIYQKSCVFSAESSLG